MKLKTHFLQTLDLTSQLATIKRSVGYRERHTENDAEHSYQVAMIAWSLNHQYHLNLNEEKLLKLALVHDLVEIYAGDVDSHSNKKRQLNKKENEERALQQLKENYPDLTEIVKIL